MTAGARAYRAAKNGYRCGRRVVRHVAVRLRGRRTLIAVLVYHRVLPGRAENPLETIVPLDTFRAQVEALARRFRIIPLSGALRSCRTGEARSGTELVLTFDDGYADNYEHVFPVLRRLGLPAAFFVISGSVGAAEPLWDWQVVQGILHSDVRALTAGPVALTQRPGEARPVFAFRVLDVLKSRPMADICGLIAQLPAQRWAARDRFMTWDELRRMQADGMEVGSHSTTHRALARLAHAEAVGELHESREAIERHVGSVCRYFAFPFGSRRDFNAPLVEATAAAGYEGCLLNVHGVHAPGDGARALRRIIMTEHSQPRWVLG